MREIIVNFHKHYITEVEKMKKRLTMNEALSKFAILSTKPDLSLNFNEDGTLDITVELPVTQDGKDQFFDMIDFIRTDPNTRDLFKSTGMGLTKGLIKNGRVISEKSLRRDKKLFSQLREGELDYLEYLWFKQAKEKEGKKGRFKRSGHLTDQILKYSYKNDGSVQPSLFDSLPESTRDDIINSNTSREELIEGIRVSPSEQKVIDCFTKMLHEKSQNIDPKKADYYTGNRPHELTEYGDDHTTPVPKLAFTLYELTQEYKGGEAVSGKDVENVRNIINTLNNRRFLVSYTEKTPKKDGGWIERKIEVFKPLIDILKISETEYSKENIEKSKKEDTVILLNPIFRSQIYSKSIDYPNDIMRRTIIAYGSHNISETAIRLREWLNRERCSKHYNPEIYLERLYYMLNDKWMKEGRKKKVKQYTDKAIETVTTLGLLNSYEILPGITGEQKALFHINKNWE